MNLSESIGNVFTDTDFPELIGGYYENCTFQRCKFIGSPIKNSRFVECRFECCDLSISSVTGSSFRNVTFSDCKAVGVNWSTSAGIHSGSFLQCKLNDCTFTQLDLRNIVFKECSLENADFRESRLEKASFSGSNLTGAQFNRTNLIDADFSEAHHYFFDPRSNKLKNTKVSMPEAIGLLEVLGATLTH